MTGKQAKVATEKPTIRIPIRRPSTKAKTGKGAASDSETAAAVKPKKTPKKKGRGKKVAETVESGSDEGEDDGDEVDWKDVSLNWSLISGLEENETIKHVLFPMPGEKAALNVAGKPKTEQQYRLAEILFKDHEKYGAVDMQ